MCVSTYDNDMSYSLSGITDKYTLLVIPQTEAALTLYWPIKNI